MRFGLRWEALRFNAESRISKLQIFERFIFELRISEPVS
jgi:hypothetical protein